MTPSEAGRTLGQAGAPGRAEAARLLGRRRSGCKALAARENGQGGGRPYTHLPDIACNCGGTGNGLKDHRSTCRRGHTIRRRYRQEHRKDRPSPA